MPIPSSIGQLPSRPLHPAERSGNLIVLAAGLLGAAGCGWGLHSPILGGIVFGVAVIVFRHHNSAIKALFPGERGAARATAIPQETAPLYSSPVEAIPQIVWTALPDGSVDFYNQRWCDYTGLPISEPWLNALHPDDSASCEARWLHSLASGAEFEAEARIKQHAGAWRWYLIRALPSLNEEGKIIKWFGTCTEIEHQKRAEEAMRFLADASNVLSTSLDKLETLRNVAHLAVPKIADLCMVHLVVHAAGGDQLLLAAVAHMDAKKADMMVQFDRQVSPNLEHPRELANVIRTGTSNFIREVDEEHLAGLDIDDAYRAVFRELGVQSLMCVPLRGQRDILGAITFISAESGRNYTHRDLSLAEEVGRRTALALDNNHLFAEVTQTKAEAQAANAAKDELLAVLSHELRTPLTPVLLAIEELKHEGSLPPHIREVIDMAHRNVELESRLIDDLLDLTRIQRGKLQLQRVSTDSHALLHNALEICQGDIRNRNLRISLGLSAARHHVHADPARLQQVFWNLIKNAVKFTNPGGMIVFRSRNTSKGRLQIEIEDSGIGIDSALLPYIFDAFEQGEKSRSRRFGGLGLGLAISKNLIEAHGGSITVQSPGRDLGSKFTIELDTVEAEMAHENGVTPVAHDAAPASGLRILLVEDNPETGTLLRKILERRGYHVDLATTMQGALKLSAQITFDVLVSDVGLPDGSGLELMQRLRQTRYIPGIAMSGYGMDADIRRSREAGFCDHLTKPLSIAKLEESIARIASAPV